MNLYAYVNNDPMNNTDPFGLLDDDEEENPEIDATSGGIGGTAGQAEQ